MVISPITGETFCRKNGQFLKHLRSHNFTSYQQLFDSMFPDEVKLCRICGSKSSFDSPTMQYSDICGSKSCTGVKISENKNSRTDEEISQFREKFRTTMSKKSSNEINHIKDKRIKTFTENYGTSHPWKNKEVREKIRITTEQKYGVPNVSSALVDPESKRRLEDRDWLYNQHVVLQKPLYVIAEELGVGDRTVGIHLKKHGIDTQSFQHSRWEHELKDFLNSHGIRFEQNNRTLIAPKEVDFYLPDFNIAIELCGLYWHSERLERITRIYHKEKYDLCKSKGKTLLTVFEDEWELKHIIFSKLLYLTKQQQRKVHARKLTIDVTISHEERSNFLNHNHIQGDGKGSIVIGLRNHEELVAVAVFSSESDGKFNLVRYATSITVVGGFTKIISQFEKMFSNFKQIKTFSDNRWSNGNLYEQCGFECTKELPPDYFYVVKGKRVHKFNFRHKHLHKRLKIYNPLLSERENCVNNGIYRIWDCGKKQYVRYNKRLHQE